MGSDASPDLDHGPEVFETSDVESEAGLDLQEEQNESIARDPLALAQDAAASYESSAINDELTLADFLGTVSRRLGQSGYSVERAGESRRQKLSRIALELEELLKEEGDLEIEELGKQLEVLTSKDRVDPELDLGISGVFKDIDAALKVKENVEPTAGDEVLRLEKRIAELEDLVGTTEEPPSSLRNALNNASRKVSVLYDHESELSAVKAEIKLLNKEMELLATNRRMAQVASGSKEPVSVQISFEHKVSSLYDRLAEFDRANTTVPLILTRLRSLNRVHAESGHAIECVSNLDKTLAELAQDMKKWDESIDKIDKSINEQSEAFGRNSEVFQKKMNAVLERIEKLEGQGS